MKWHRHVTWSLLAFIVGASIGSGSTGGAGAAGVLVLLVSVVVGAGLFIFQSGGRSGARSGPQGMVIACLVLGLLRGFTAPAPPQSFASPTLVQRVLYQRLEKTIGSPEAGLATSILIGDRTQLTQTIKDDFRNSGLSHVLAISGYNVTMVIRFLSLLINRVLPRRFRLVVAIIGVALFVGSAGFSAPVVRAGIMGSIGAIALHQGRATSAQRLLLVAATGMIVVQPWLAVADVGFQLSVAATAAIIWLVRPLLKKFKKIPNIVGLRETLAMTIAATLGTLPIITVHFGTLSLYAIAANCVAAPLIPLTMASGAVAVAGFGIPAEYSLKLLTATAHLFANIPGNTITISHPFWLVPVEVCVVGILVFWLYRREPVRPLLS